QLGVENLPQEKASRKVPIESLLEGELAVTPHGEVFQVEEQFPLDYQQGNTPLLLSSSLDLISAWAGDERIAAHSPEQFAFVDTETTGLAGGSGTYAFMVGVGRFEPEGFHLMQFFMRDPSEEPALLHALEQFLAPCETVVSFNGKSYDLPLLHARYTTNGWPFPLQQTAHLDLLHLARRLWRDRLPSRTLTYLEEHILEQTRTGEDTPGYMIPELYFEYLRSGDARPLKGIFYHNAMDILTLAALTNHIAHLLTDPLDGRVAHALDLAAIGKLNEDLGYLDKAARILAHSLEHPMPGEIKSQVMKRLSFVHKRRGEMPEALSLWWQAAADREMYAHEELAKYFEHT
ncbi:MAG: ribonuclease H-like domain-containing protein, partial [Anaerolineales bacterium]